MTARLDAGEESLAKAKIIPRWEWRTFGEQFGAAEIRLGELTPERSERSDETYLLSLGGDASVKVREGRLDVKRLLSVNRDGLEQWMPVLKAAFPLRAETVAAVLEGLGLDAPPLTGGDYTLARLVDEVVAPCRELRAVEVRKRRRHYLVGGCMTELSELETTVGASRTIAIESEDPALVIATVRELGLESRQNTCLARGLKRLVGFTEPRRAVIDVGTNSVKFVIGEQLAQGGWQTIVDRAEVTRLGQGLAESGRLGDEPIERTVVAIAGMADEARRNGAETIVAVGTAGLRVAANSAALVAGVRERAGIEVEVISGEEEARLAYLAATSGLELGGGSLVVFDTGGGSSQFTFGERASVRERFSVNVGAVRFAERYRLDDVVSAEALAGALEAIALDLAALDGRPSPDLLVGMGGAVTNLAAVTHGLVEYDAAVVQGTVLDLAEIDRQIELYRTRTVNERRQIPGLQPKRAEVILAGACIIRTVIAKLDRESLTVSDRGLRHGLLAEQFAQRD